MRLWLLASFSVAALASASAASQPARRAPIEGRWVGTGSFFDAQWDAAVGALPCSLSVFADGTGGGRIGPAAFDLLRTGDQGMIGKLSGPVAPQLASKEYVVFVVTAVTDSTLEGEFHLKSNRYYDLRMREGKLSLRRISP